MNFDQKSIEQENKDPLIGKFTGVDGEIYISNIRTVYYNEMAKIILKSIPKVEENYIRLWRGSRPNEVNQNTIVTNSLIGIALPFMYAYEGVMAYVDVPKSEFMNYVSKGAVAENSEFMLPNTYKGKFKVVDPNIYKKFEAENPNEMMSSKI